MDRKRKKNKNRKNTENKKQKRRKNKKRGNIKNILLKGQIYKAYILYLPKNLQSVNRLRPILAQILSPTVLGSTFVGCGKNEEVIIRSTNPEIVRKLKPLKYMYDNIQLHSENQHNSFITARNRWVQSTYRTPTAWEIKRQKRSDFWKKRKMINKRKGQERKKKSEMLMEKDLKREIAMKRKKYKNDLNKLITLVDKYLSMDVQIQLKIKKIFNTRVACFVFFYFSVQN